MTVNLVYDEIGKMNLNNHPGTGDFDGFKLLLFNNSIPFTQNSILDKNIDGKSFYTVIPHNFAIFFEQSENNFINYLSETVIQRLVDPSDKLQLLIFFPLEGYLLTYFNYSILKTLNSLVEDKNIPSSKIYFLHGDLNIRNVVQNLPFKCRLPIDNFYGINLFESIAYEDYYRSIDCLTGRYENKLRRKRLLNKNGNARTNRIYLTGALQNKELLSKCFFSWLNHFQVDYEQPGMLEGIFNMLSPTETLAREYEKAFREIIAQEPIVLDLDQNAAKDRNNQIKFSPELYLESYCSLVTETSFDEDNVGSLFITEKIYQPIYNFHPFIVSGSPGLLTQLRNDGYQTFPELFDESYDNVEDAGKRINKILEEIERYLNRDITEIHSIFFSQSFQDKLKHNWKNFVTRESRSKCINLVSWLVDNDNSSK